MSSRPVSNRSLSLRSVSLRPVGGRSTRGSGRAIASAAVALAVTWGLAGCLPIAPVSEQSVPTGEQVATELEPYYHQVLQWKPCGRMQCATAIAPLDWAHPDSASDIQLALVRQTATSGERVGSLLVNPGGPGASGVDFISQSIDFATGKPLQRRFDVVGFDPRGVGESTAINCGGPPVLDAYLYDIPDAKFGSDAWIAALAESSAAFGKDCLKDSGDLLGRVDTASAARDLDMLRAALGDETLNYLGYSYGTLLGAVYAELFPKRTGRLVLDGAIDPTASGFDMSLAQAVGFERAFDAYAAWCLGQRDCPFKGGVANARERTAALLASLASSPMTARDGREVGSSTMFTAIVLPLYSKQTWGVLSQLFADTLRGDPETALSLADSYNNRRADGTYDGNLTEAFIAIHCLDERTGSSLDTIRQQERQLVTAAPLFGIYMAFGDGCADWPVPAVRARTAISAPGSAPILVVGTTRDPATPYEWAVTLAGTLESGHLLSYEGDGHTAYNKGSACVDTAVEAFLLDGVVPESGTRC